MGEPPLSQGSASEVFSSVSSEDCGEQQPGSSDSAAAGAVQCGRLRRHPRGAREGEDWEGRRRFAGQADENDISMPGTPSDLSDDTDVLTEIPPQSITAGMSPDDVQRMTGRSTGRPTDIEAVKFKRLTSRSTGNRGTSGSQRMSGGSSVRVSAGERGTEEPEQAGPDTELLRGFSGDADRVLMELPTGEMSRARPKKASREGKAAVQALPVPILQQADAQSVSGSSSSTSCSAAHGSYTQPPVTTMESGYMANTRAQDCADALPVHCPSTPNPRNPAPRTRRPTT